MTITDQYIFLGTLDLRGKVYSSFDFSGGSWKIKSGGAVSLVTTNRKDSPDGGSVKFSVCFDNETEASLALQYLYPFNPDSPDFVEADGADIALYIRGSDWYYPVWGVVTAPDEISKETMDFTQFNYVITCYLYSPYSYYRTPAKWVATNQALSKTSSISNVSGHLPSSFESLQITTLYNSGLASALAINFGGDSLTLADNCLTNEIWELRGNESLLLQTYEDAITSATQWGHDWTGTGEAFDTDHMELDNGVSQYIKLSGPQRLAIPVKMTADLSLDSGGATGQAKVYISEDATTWIEVMDQDDFESGSTEYSLQGSDNMKNCYVKFYCNSGTSGKYLNIGSIKFECKRMLPYDAPTVAAGTTATATLTGSGNVTIDGEFIPRRMHV